jgi:hypothetical protein
LALAEKGGRPQKNLGVQSRSSSRFIHPQQEGSDGQTYSNIGGSRHHVGIGCMVGKCAIARRFERAERAGAECDDHPQGRLQRPLGPLVPAGLSHRAPPGSLGVRSLLMSEHVARRRLPEKLGDQRDEI